MILSTRLLNIPVNRDILIKLLAFLVINLFTGYLSLLIPGWIPGLLLLALSCVISSILLGLLRPSALRRIFRA
jgi:hypothetical protein